MLIALVLVLAGSGHVYYVALGRAPRHTVEYACGALRRAPCIHARLRRLATKPASKINALLMQPSEGLQHTQGLGVALCSSAGSCHAAHDRSGLLQALDKTPLF